MDGIFLDRLYSKSPLDDSCLLPDSRGIVGHIIDDERQSPDSTVIPDVYITQYLSISAYLDIVADSWSLFAVVYIAHCYALPHCAVFTNYSVWIYKYSPEMPNPQPLSDHAIFWYTHPRNRFDNKLGYFVRYQIHCLGNAILPFIYTLAKPINTNSPERLLP